MRVPTFSYFPEIYPGELLHGVLSRWARRSRVDSPGAAAEVLFGDRHAIASWDLPGRLDELSARIPATLSLGSESLIARTTLEPYYTAFCSAETRSWVRDAMRGSVASVHVRLGLTASRISRPKRAQYCPDCNRESLALHGELYWRRAHQLPGVLVCSEHCRPLLESPALLSRLGRHGYLLANSDTCPEGGQPTCSPGGGRALEDLREVAASSADLLEQPPPPLSISDAAPRYRELARRAGLMLSPNRVDVSRLSGGFRVRFGSMLSHLEGTDPAGGGGDGWLVAMTRRHRKAMHPLLHILASKHLQELQVVTKPVAAHDPAFGPGPWPCRNPLAAHYGSRVTERLTQYSNRRAIVGVFACSCGYEYTRGVDERGHLGPPRYRSFGPLLGPLLASSVAQRKSLRAIARQTKLDPKTVATEARALGIEVRWTCGRARPRNVPRVTTSVKLHKPRVTAPRTDWRRVDCEEVVRVRHTAKTIRWELPPVRITRAEVERRLGRRDWLRRRRLALPLANGELDAVAEPLEAFQRRRLRWALYEMNAYGGDVPVWRVLRLAGLPAQWHTEATQLLFGDGEQRARAPA